MLTFEDDTVQSGMPRINGASSDAKVLTASRLSPQGTGSNGPKGENSENNDSPIARRTSINWCRSSTNGHGRSIFPPALTIGCRRKST